MPKYDGPPRNPRIISIFEGERISFGGNQDGLIEKISGDRLGQAFDSVNDFFEDHREFSVSSALPALKLYLLVSILSSPKTDTLEINEKIEGRLRRIADIEKKFSDPKNCLPTVGVEIEVPKKVVNSGHEFLLRRIGIPNTRERWSLHEFKPKFTYSPWTQGRILEDLSKLGLIPKDEEPISMHVNFGVPGHIIFGDLLSHQKDTVLLNDLFVYAYSSPARIMARKTDLAYKYDRAEPEPKNRSNLRVEFRANEFKDYPTYRLLVETQRLVAMYLAYLKKMLRKETLSETEERLALLWEDFEKEARKFLYEDQSIPPRIYDQSKKQTVDIMERDLGLKEKSRVLMTKYSKLVAGIINLDQEPEKEIPGK